MAAALLALVLTACGAESVQPVIAPSPATPAATPQSEVPPEHRIADPKDARGVAPCDLLIEEQLIALGLQPGTGAPTRTSVAAGCGWEYAADPLNLAAAGVQVGTPSPTLARVYEGALGGRYEPVQDVSGHPAARGSRNPNECVLMVAVADDQLLGVFPNIAGRSLSDPCALPRRMAELILSNLPPQS